MGWLRDLTIRLAEPLYYQQLSFPCTVDVRRVLGETHLFRWPVKEIEHLYEKSSVFGSMSIEELNHKIAIIQGELLDISIEFEPDTVTFDFRGKLISYNKDTEVFSVGRTQVRAPARNGRVSLRALLDRTSLELFANKGESVASIVHLFDRNNTSIRFTGKSVQVYRCEIHSLRSSWE